MIDGVQREGVCWVGGTTWNREPAMRISISNWMTSAEDVDRSAASILAHAASLAAQSHPNPRTSV